MLFGVERVPAPLVFGFSALFLLCGAPALTFKDARPTPVTPAMPVAFCKALAVAAEEKPPLDFPLLLPLFEADCIRA